MNEAFAEGDRVEVVDYEGGDIPNGATGTVIKDDNSELWPVEVILDAGSAVSNFFDRYELRKIGEEQ